MNKINFIFLGVIFLCNINVTNVMSQNTTASSVFAIIDNTALQNSAIQINYINVFSQNVPAKSAIIEKIFLISSENENMFNSVTQNIASFSISNDNINSFTVSLPSQPILLKNMKTGNTIQVSDWKSDSYSLNDTEQKNVKVINLGASLKMDSLNKDKIGEYIGSYPVTLIY